jgi:hypothetical protein
VALLPVVPRSPRVRIGERSVAAPPGASRFPLLGGLSALGPCLCAFHGSLRGLAELVVEICQLPSQVRHTLVEVGGLMLGVGGHVSSPARLGAGAAGAGLGFGAQLFEQPDALDQSLSLRRIHVLNGHRGGSTFVNPKVLLAAVTCLFAMVRARREGDEMNAALHFQRGPTPTARRCG